MKISVVEMRLAMVVVAVADMLVFARATGITLIAMGIGTATVFLGSLYSYRVASGIGVLTICGAAANAIEITTLTDIGGLMTAALGIVVPVVVLALVSLSAEKEDIRIMVVRRGPVLRVLAYVLGCLFAVPVAAVLISVAAPGVSMRLPTMAESAILLVVTIAAGVVLTWREPRATAAEEEE